MLLPQLISVILDSDSFGFQCLQKRKMILGFHLGMEIMLILRPSSWNYMGKHWDASGKFSAKTSDRMSDACSIAWKTHRPFLVLSLTVLSLSPHSKNHSETWADVSKNASLCPISSSVCISTGWTMRQSNVVSEPCHLSDPLGSSAVFSWYHIKDTYVHMR